ncbi:MAG: SDR family NAD(P)-dependent oxidoreductase [Pseudomonadota bacterium]|nr:SDR family NAD(P)-dependent oxidoreductase [Pseudomonadota bacterium]
MDLGIRGKKAIINGGSAGMGKGSAIALAREGVDLVISSRGKDRLENTCEEIRKETGVKVIGVATDHSTDEGREKIINACPDPDILVGTCTPPMTTPDYEKISPDDWRKTLEVSLLSPVSFMKELIPGMVKKKMGKDSQYWNWGGKNTC